MRDVREIIATEIKTCGFKQSVIAAKAGLTEQQLSDIVNKRRRLEANEMFSLCQAMRIDSNYLFQAAQEL